MGTTTQISNADRIRTLFQSILAGDVAAITSAFHPDLVVDEPEGLPFGGVYRGREAFLNVLASALMVPYELEIEDVVTFGDGDRVAANMSCVFTSRRTGKTLRTRYVELYSFKDGLVAEADVYPKDTKAIAAFMAENG